MPLIVCQTGICECSQGSLAAALVSKQELAAKFNGQACLTRADTEFKGGAFGICKLLTSRNSGTPTPCQPAVAETWEQKTLSPLVNECQLLTSDAKISCQEGGQIHITNAGQNAMGLT